MSFEAETHHIYVNMYYKIKNQLLETQAVSYGIKGLFFGGGWIAIAFSDAPHSAKKKYSHMSIIVVRLLDSVKAIT